MGRPLRDGGWSLPAMNNGVKSSLSLLNELDGDATVDRRPRADLNPTRVAAPIIRHCIQ